MCTIIVTIRSVLWYVVSLAGTLMILVALFTNKWLEGQVTGSNFQSVDGIFQVAKGIGQTVMDGDIKNVIDKNAGLFLHCKVPEGKKFFEGECIPELDQLEKLFTDLNDDLYPHAWRGAVVCFVFGLTLMVITDLFALMTICCRHCICCSVFTICGSLQSFATILFTLGLVAYPAGWGSKAVADNLCGGNSAPFILGSYCTIGGAFWLAVAGTVACGLASSLAIWAYQSTRSAKCEERMDQGDNCICLP